MLFRGFILATNAISFGYAFQLQRSPRTRPSTVLFQSLSTQDETLLGDTLVRWLVASGCSPDVHSVRVDSNKDGLRGLYANRDVLANEIIFDIPYKLALETGDTLKDGENGKILIGCDLDNVDSDEWDKETIYDVYQGLMLLNRMEEDDWIWDPYLCNIEAPPESENEAGFTPDFWSDELIQDIQIPSFVKEIMARKAIVKSVAEKNDVDENELRWATWMLRSRRFTTWDNVLDPSHDDDQSLLNKIIPKKVEQIKGYLLPLIDMANHSHEPNAQMEITVDKWTKKFDDTSSFALRALKPIANDEEITISYGSGDWTCLQMMDKYGFFLEGNSADDKFDWAVLESEFSTSVEEDQMEKNRLIEGKVDHGSKIDMLSLRIFVKKLMTQ